MKTIKHLFITLIIIFSGTTIGYIMSSSNTQSIGFLSLHEYLYGVGCVSLGAIVTIFTFVQSNIIKWDTKFE